MLVAFAPLLGFFFGVAAVLFYRKRTKAKKNKKQKEDTYDVCLLSSSSSSVSSGGGLVEAAKRGSVTVDHGRRVSRDSLFKELYDDSEEDDDDDDEGYADPVHDDLYARKMGSRSQPAASEPHNKFLPKVWTPEEDFHFQKIKLGSQRRPWYKKMQGFRCVLQRRSSLAAASSSLTTNPLDLHFPPCMPT